MADEKQASEKLPYPIRSGAVPTPDGVFPVDLSGGGTRRRRRAHIDIDGHDAKVAAENERAAILSADREIEAIQKDATHPLFVILDDILTAAPTIRSLEALSSAHLIRERELEAAADQPKQLAVGDLGSDRIAASEANTKPAENERPNVPVDQREPLESFLARLSAVPAVEAKAVLGDHWDGNDDTFAEAVESLWGILTTTAHILPSGTAADSPGGGLAADQTADESGAQGPAGEPGQPAEAPKPVVVPDPPKPARKRAANDPTK